MKIFGVQSGSLIIAALALTPVTAVAQDTATASAAPVLPITITPYVALGSVRSSDVGVGVSFPLTHHVSLETEVGYRRGEGHIHALSSSANLIVDLPRIQRTIPYFAAGAGLEEYGTAVVLPDGSGIATHPRISFAVNAGGGLKIPVDDTWGLRVDARWFKSFGRHASSEHWRVAHGISFGPGKR